MNHGIGDQLGDEQRERVEVRGGERLAGDQSLHGAARDAGGLGTGEVLDDQLAL